MGKFKVGDKVELLNGGYEYPLHGFKNGEVYKVIGESLSSDTFGGDTRKRIKIENGSKQGYALPQDLKPIEPKPSKKQRIETLEKEVSELKLIVHELRERKPSVFATLEGQDLEAEYAEQVKGEPSTDAIIEFEGAKYRKVDREAREGDVIIVKSPAQSTASVELNVPYKVVECSENKTWITFIHYAFLYERLYSRTPETVDVYELITEPSTTTTVEDNPFDWVDYPLDETKTPNQLRAEVIEKAKAFVDENGGDDYHFEVDEEKRTVFAWKIEPLKRSYYAKCDLATCHSNDVFNADIGKAIAFGRAEGLDVSEFEQAVQPSEPVIGMEILIVTDTGTVMGVDVPDEVEKHGDRFLLSRNGEGLTGGGCHSTYRPESGAKIINDTNAIYGGVE